MHGDRAGSAGARKDCDPRRRRKLSRIEQRPATHPRGAGRAVPAKRRSRAVIFLVATGRRAECGAGSVSTKPESHTNAAALSSTRDCAPPTGAFTPSATWRAGCNSRMPPIITPGLVIRNAVFRLPVSVNDDLVPRVTFTDPELAHAGSDRGAGARASQEDLACCAGRFTKTTARKPSAIRTAISRSSPRRAARFSAPPSWVPRPAK